MWPEFALKALQALVALRKWAADVQAPEPPVEVKFVECVHRGLGPPDDIIGEPGHWYMDQGACELWGPKTAFGWPDARAYLLRSAMMQFNLYDQMRLDRAAHECLNRHRRNHKESFDV